jgi:hypothetical protein
MPKRTYNLTEADIRNLASVEETGGFRSTCDALSSSIWLTAYLQQVIARDGGILQIRKSDGVLVEIATPLFGPKVGPG